MGYGAGGQGYMNQGMQSPFGQAMPYSPPTQSPYGMSSRSSFQSPQSSGGKGGGYGAPSYPPSYPSQGQYGFQQPRPYFSSAMQSPNQMYQQPYSAPTPSPAVNQTQSPAQPVGIATAQPAQPTNPFEGNAQYQALMEYQKSLAPTQEQQQRLQELQSAFEGTGAYKDYRIQQLENQQRQMMSGLGGYRDRFGPRMKREFGGFRPFPGMENVRRIPPMRRPMPNPMGVQVSRPLPGEPIAGNFNNLNELERRLIASGDLGFLS